MVDRCAWLCMRTRTHAEAAALVGGMARTGPVGIQCISQPAGHLYARGVITTAKQLVAPPVLGAHGYSRIRQAVARAP